MKNIIALLAVLSLASCACKKDCSSGCSSCSKPAAACCGKDGKCCKSGHKH